MPFASFSQGGLQNDFDLFMSHLYEHVDLNQVNTGFLWDKSRHLQDFEVWDGVDTSSANLSDIDRFGLLYATLYSGNTSPVNPIPAPSVFMQSVLPVTDHSDTIPISLLLSDYNKIRDDVFSANLMVMQDSQLYDVPGRPYSPYWTRRLFAASCVQSTTTNDSIWFQLPSNLLFTHIPGVSVSVIQADFDDNNGLVTLQPDSTHLVVYPTGGQYRIFFRITLSNGEVMIAHTSFNKSLSVLNKYDDISNFNFNIPASTLHSGGLINIIYAENECEEECPDHTWPHYLKKPFIVIDGFDPPQRGEDGARHYDNIIERIKIRSYVINNTEISLGNYLQENGYDLIFIDFNWGTDYCHRNALMVEEAIDQINKWKNGNGSYEPNIVVGASSGGLVGKYALLNMEEAGKDHQVSKYFTLDSPLWGANFPVAFQYAVYHANDIALGVVEGLQNSIAILDEPFTKQLLTYNLATDLDQSIFNAFHADFHSKGINGNGELMHCEQIALSNGTINGIGQENEDGSIMAPGQKLMSVHGRLSPLAEWLGPDPENQYGCGEPVFWKLASWITAISQLFVDVHADVTLKAIGNPADEVTVYDGQYYVYSIIGSIATSIPIVIPLGIQNHKISGKQPIDVFPGGYVYDLACIGKALETAKPNIVDNNHVAFCFVPSVSALDIGFATTANAYLDYSSSANTGIGTVDRFLGSTTSEISNEVTGTPQWNTFHAFIHEVMARFLVNDLCATATPSNLSLLNNKTYNYGDSKLPFIDPGVFGTPPFVRTSQFIHQDIEVRDIGKLWVNRNGRIAYTNIPANPANMQQGDFHLFIESGDECAQTTSAVVKIIKGGELTVGEWDGAAIQNRGVVMVRNGGKIVADEQGTVQISDHSLVNIGKGGVLDIKKGGLVNLSWPDATLRADFGGIIHVEDGGTLRVNSGAKVIIENGGKIILDPGAVIQLWDGQQEDGTSTIHVKKGGIMEWNGDIAFSGNGYFQFDNEHQFIVAESFNLKGYSPEHRFIRLNYTPLNIGTNKKVNLYSGKIQYAGAGVVHISDGTTCTMSDLTFEGVEGAWGIGLKADKPAKVLVSNCTSRGMKGVADISSALAGAEVVLQKLKIVIPDGPDKFAIALRNSFNTPILSDVHASALTANMNNTGIITEYCENVQVRDCQLDDISFGIVGKGVNNLSLYNTTITNSGVGISNPPTPSGLRFPVNVFLYSGTTIKNCAKGIEIFGTTQSGAVSMSCSHLINNEVGIFGEDITLLIDAYDNRVCPDPITPNEFNLGDNGLWHFNICYKHKIPTVINAKGNYWMPANPNPDHWNLTKNYSCSEFVSVNTAFSVPVSGLSACSGLQQFVVTSTVTNINCGLMNGSIVLNPTGGLTPYSFDWADIAGAANVQNRSAIGAGTYVVTITDASGCSIVLTNTVSETPAVSLVPTVTQPTCGVNNGAIAITVTSGTAPYTYNWSDITTSPEPKDRVGLGAGTYTITVTDANNCTKALSFTLVQTGSGLSLTAVVTNAGCAGATGAINLSVSGGNSPFVFNWQDIVTGIEPEDRTGLAAGTYLVTVTSATGCSASGSWVIQASGLNISGNATNTTCGLNNGTITAQASGATPTYTYDWPHIAGANNPANLTGLAAGTYTVTVTAGNGCTATKTYIVGGSTAVTYTSTVINASCGASSGSIAVVGAGSVSPYYYDWAHIPGSVNPATLSNLPANSYSITVSSSVGCTASSYITVAGTTPVTVTPTVVNPSCNLNNGSVSLSTSGAPGPYTYDWSHISGTNNPQNQSGLAGGIYTVTVTASSGCTAKKIIAMDQTGIPAIISTVTHSACNASTGAISLSVNGGSAPYSFDWAHIPGANNPQTLSGLAPSAYYVTVTDANGCTKNTITSVQLATVGFTGVITNPTSGANGAINLSVNAGVAPYTFDWQHIPGTNNPQNVSGLMAGNYSVTVTGANACSSSKLFSVGAGLSAPYDGITHDQGQERMMEYDSDIQKSAVRISPNPASESFSIYIPELYSLADIMIYDAESKVILKTQGSGVVTIDASPFSPGIYFVYIWPDNDNKTILLPSVMKVVISK